jgi:methionine-rich copper-binding protein CopC/putative copper export protein/ABC-type branched-subunit amino acid transport system substrate-binding protein
VTTRRSPRRSRGWLRRGGGIVLLTAFFGLAVATPAVAHPYLLSSDPASGAILTSAPSQLDISYTEGLDRSYCTVTLIAPNGRRIGTHQVTARQPTELSVVPNTVLTQRGTYAVNWTAVGDDGHTVIGNFGFSIGHPSANAAVSSATTADTGTATSAGGAQRLLRTILPFATVVLAGLLLLGSTLAASGRRAARLRAWTFGAQAVIVSALAVVVVADGGWSPFWSSATGHRLIVELLLTALALPVVVDGGQLARGERSTGPRRWLAPPIAVGLVVVLAFSGHASSQPHSRRALALAVYSVHLLAVSVWLGALAAVLLRVGRADRDLSADAGDPARRLRPLVAGSLLAVLVTGVATTDWGLRTLHDVPGTLYGRLSLTLLALFVLIVAIGGTASWLHLHRGRRRLGGWLVGVEAVLAAATLVVAGVLGQIAQPLDQPYASQAYATDAGLPVSVAAAGADSLDVATLAPGVVGPNTLVVEVGHADADDFLSPALGVKSVVATVSCGGCGETDQRLSLHPTGDGAAWTASLNLDQPASYLVTTQVRRDGEPSGQVASVQASARVTESRLPDQEVIGVPAGLSGADGETCRDQTLGLQVAFADLNASAADHGDLIRVVAVDLHNGVAAAFARLRALGARMIAMPCGTERQVSRSLAAARAAGLPVVLGSTTDDALGPRVWSTEPSWQAEGAAIGRQAITQEATSVTVVVGRTAVDHAELAGLRQALAGRHVELAVSGFPKRPVGYVRSLARRHADVVALLGDRTEAAPVVRAFSATENAAGWMPSHGILASAQLMSTDFINDAGTITRLGGIEFASNINPFDPVSQYYAQRLRTLSPGLRPSFDGLDGYEAGLAIAEALKDGGGRPSSAELAALFGQRFTHFSVGSYQLGWRPDGGTSTSLAFFRSTYVNPMAMPVDSPGGASALAHEGTFLDTGGFEQVAPFREVS